MLERSPEETCVLLVEDERRYRSLMVEALRLQGYTTAEAEDGKTALELAMHRSFNLVLLDLMLPDLDGFDVCRRLRDFTSAPIIMVTALGEDRDIVRGLDGGADDYLTKPFSVQELLARVRALLRRTAERASATPGGLLIFGDLCIDDQSHRVTLADNEILLSRIEYKLLWLLASNAGRVLVPEVIAERVWNAPDGEIGGVLKTTIGRLREKLGDDKTEPTFIHTRRGVGYLFAPKQQPNLTQGSSESGFSPN